MTDNFPAPLRGSVYTICEERIDPWSFSKMRYLQATIIGVTAGVLLNVVWLAASLAWLAWSTYRDGSGIGSVAGGFTDVPVPILFLFGFIVAFAWSLRTRPVSQLR